MTDRSIVKRKSFVYFKYHGIGIPAGISKNIPKECFHIDGDTIFTKAGERFRFYHDRRVPIDSVKYVRIKSNGKSTVVFACETTMQELHRTATGKVGICFNTKPFITFSNGQQIFAPAFIVKNAGNVRKLNERLQHCVSPKTARKIERQITNLYKHAHSKLEDWHYKIAHRICRRFNEIHIPRQLPSTKFANDYDFAGFVHKLYAVSRKYKVRVIAAHNNVLTCPNCGNKRETPLRPQDKHWTCEYCGNGHSVDILLAKQIELFE